MDVPKDKLIEFTSDVELPGNTTDEIVNLCNIGKEKYSISLKKVFEEVFKDQNLTVKDSHINPS